MRGRSAAATAILTLVVILVAFGGAAAWALGAASARVREMATAALSAALRRDVAIGRVTGDPWRGVTFEDVRLPSPAVGQPPVFEARRLTVYIDLRAALRDVFGLRGLGPSVTANVSQVIVDEPVARIVHDRSRWNLSDLLPAGGGASAAPGFRGRIVILDGTVLLTDRARMAPRTFAARLTDVNGTVDFAGSPRLALRASFVEDRAGRRTAGRVAGAYTLDRQVLDIDLQASDADAAAWGRYLLPTSAFRVTAGRVDAQVHLLRTPAAGGTATDVSGRVVVRGGAAVFPGRPASVAAVNGELQVSNRSLTTSGLRGVLNGSPVEVRGEISFYGEPRVDLAARSNAADLTALGRLFFPSLVSRVAGTVRGEVRVVGPASAPRLWGRVESGRGTLDRRPFDAASAEVALYGGIFRLSGARGRVDGAAVQAEGIWTLGAPRFFLELNIAGASAAMVRQWTPAALPPFEGRVSGTLAIAGRPDGITLAGQGTMTQGRVAGTAVDVLDAAFRYDPGGMRIDHARIRQGGVWASGSGRVGGDGTIGFDLLGAASNVTALPMLPGPSPISGPVAFAGRVRGTVDEPRAGGWLQLGPGRVREMPFDSASGRIMFRPGMLTIDDARLRSGYARYRASGTVGLSGPLTLALELEAERAPAETLGRLAGLPSTIFGRVDGRVRLDGPVARPVANGAVTLRDAKAWGQTFDEAAASFRWDGRRLTIAGGSVRRQQSTVHVAGTFDRLTGLALDVSGERIGLHDLSLTGLGPTRIDGHVDVTGRVTGMLASPVLALQASSRDLTINNLRFDHAEGSVRWDDGTIRLEPLALRTNGQRYEVRGAVTWASAPNVSLTWKVTDGRLSTLLGFAGTRLGVPLDGVITGDASLEGPLGNPTARLDLVLGAGRFGDHPLRGHMNLTLSNGSVAIEDLELLVGRGRIAATGRYDLRGASQIEVSGSELDLDVVRPLLRLRRPLLGRLDFTVQLGGTLAAPELGLDLEITRGGVQGATFDSLVASGFYRDGTLQLVQGLLVQNGHKLRASGNVPFNPKTLRFDDAAPLDFRLTLAEVNLGLLKVISDRVEDARGAVEGRLSINGTVAAPRLSGNVRVADGTVRLRGVTTPVEALSLAAQFQDNTIRLADTSARVGGGLLRLEGLVRIAMLPSGGPVLEVAPESPLVLQAAGARVSAPPVVDARFDGTLRAWGTLGDPRRPPVLAGRVSVSDGTLGISAPAGNGGRVSGVFPLTFGGVHMDVGRDLAVRVGDLRFVLRQEGALILTGTLAAPALEGTIEAQRGAVTALGNTFDLEEGTATFRPANGVRPQVSARATTRVGADVITLGVRGIAPDALVLDAQSDPPRPRSEILALLGRQAGISQLLTGDVTALLRAEIRRRLFAPVTVALGRALGLSELTIEYDAEQPLRLTVGKLLFPNLYITASTTFEERMRWLWALEYRFAPGWQFAFRLEPEGQRTAILWYTTRF
ncbi:MAG: translocation/assembly module TamB domain-containing protein [Armatimonadota bacterium]|nr:translocation/assembly module TamB domain-containing protein [Armatimonadota bacterium]